jgi:hypothetical protein
MKPTVADYRTRNLLILRGPTVEQPPVTAEVAGSSPVVPAIHFQGTFGRDTENSNPQLNVDSIQPRYYSAWPQRASTRLPAAQAPTFPRDTGSNSD